MSSVFDDKRLKVKRTYKRERNSPVPRAYGQVVSINQAVRKEVRMESTEARLLFDNLLITMTGRIRDDSEGMVGNAKEGDDCNELHVDVGIGLVLVGDDNTTWI